MAMRYCLILAFVASTHAFMASPKMPLSLRALNSATSARIGSVSGLKAQLRRENGESSEIYAQRIQDSSFARNMWNVIVPAIPSGAILSQIAFPVQVVNLIQDSIFCKCDDIKGRMLIQCE